MPVVNKLRFDMKTIDHAYPQHPTAHIEAWGELAIYIQREGYYPPFEVPSRVPLFETQWDIAELAVWFAANRNELCKNTLPSAGGYPTVYPRESLAQAIRRLTDRDFAASEESEADRWYDALYYFHTHHGLQFAFPGAKFPDIIIGCNQGLGEISRTSLIETDTGDHGFAYLGGWAYSFDMDDFRAELSRQLREILIQWASATQDLEARARANGILAHFE